RDYIEVEAERRYLEVSVDGELIEAVKATSSGVPLVVEMVVDALFSLGREAFLREFALEERGIIASERLDQITERFLRYCLTNPADLEQVQAMALLRKGADEAALSTLWALPAGQTARAQIGNLRSRYAFVLPDGLHDAVYDFVRHQLRTTGYETETRRQLAGRAVGHYRPRWESLDQQLEDPLRRVRSSVWQRATRDLLNALLWANPDEAVLFLLPRFIEGLGFDRAFASGLLLQTGEFLADRASVFSRTYADLLRRMQVGMQDVDWSRDEPGRAVGAMLQSLLEVPDLEPLHLSILNLMHGNWLVERGQHEAGLAAYLKADESRPVGAEALRRQLATAFYEVSSRLLWPESFTETVPSEAGWQAAERAVDLDPANGSAWFNLGTALDFLGREAEALPAYERAVALEPRARHYNSLGDLYNVLDRADEAVVAYQRAVQLDPTYAWPYHSLGQIYAERGQYAQAAEAYQQAIDHHQTDADRASSWDGFGDVQAALGEPDEAISAYRWATVLNPTYAPPWYGLGNVLTGLERFDEAAAAYQSHIRLAPAEPWAYHKLGAIYARQRRYGEAIAQYRQAIDRHALEPDQATAWEAIGDIYRAQERWPEALDAYSRATARHPRLATAWNSIGEIHLLRNHTEPAQRAFLQAVEADPALAEAWESLGDIYTRRREYNEAIEAYRRVIALEPQAPWAYNQLGLIYGRQAEYETALDFYRQAAERYVDPQPAAVAWNNMGDIYLKLGDYGQASQVYERATQLDPDYAWAYHNLGTAYFRLGDDSQAAANYRLALERHRRDEDAAVTWQALADTQRRLGDAAAALKAYQEAAARGADNPELWIFTGEMQFQLERFADASTAYQQAIKLASNDARPYDGLGQIAAGRQRFEVAADWFEQAIERYTYDQPKSRAYNRLGEARLALDQLSEAALAFRQAIALDPQPAEPYASLGGIHARRAEYDTAATYYRQALKRLADPDALGRTWTGLGQALHALNRLEPAAEAYQQAGRFDPTLVAPWIGLGDIFRVQAKAAEAKAAYQQAIDLDDSDPRPFYGRGL
ncbi:MAG TPA: tetratricopeptide repeat protein, partial [Anaerolineae bacterium]|nr:tetratricopeptide repeat protein [Anaerolineae bacterium]